MQILRPERTGTQDDSVAMVNRNDLRIEFLQSGQSEILRFAQNDSEGLRMAAMDSG
jgi:hypothetical protein